MLALLTPYRDSATIAANDATNCVTIEMFASAFDVGNTSPRSGTTTVAPGRGLGSSLMNPSTVRRLSILPLGWITYARRDRARSVVPPAASM